MGEESTDGGSLSPFKGDIIVTPKLCLQGREDEKPTGVSAFRYENRSVDNVLSQVHR